MTGGIMDDAIEQIRERVRIEDLVAQAGLTVVGRGRRPTTEEYPSLTLYVDENSWYWFSQGKGGSVFDWWMDQHGCDFGTALGELARMAGVTLRPLTPERQAAIDQERAGRQVLELATGVYHRALVNHPQARAGRDYCNARGWTAATIGACRLGFVLPRSFDSAPDGRSAQDDKALSVVDRKSTRLNSSHITISYAVFCLKKK